MIRGVVNFGLDFFRLRVVGRGELRIFSHLTEIVKIKYHDVSSDLIYLTPSPLMSKSNHILRAL